jgi:hypothetical protein
MTVTALVTFLPLALDGESSSNTNSVGIGIISLISMASVYVLLAALWYFVFREKARDKRKRGTPPD